MSDNIQNTNSSAGSQKKGLGDQFKSFVQRMSVGQRIAFFGVFIAVAVGITLIVVNMNKPEMVPLFSDLNEKDVAAVVEKLQERKVEYSLGENGTSILVPKDIVHETRINLASEGLPMTGTVGFELFDKNNLGMSDFVQKLNYQRALEGELSRTITAIQEVQKARVHIVIPKQALFERDKKEPTASVLLHLRSGRNISKVNIEGIQNLVSSSIEGMKAENVHVLDSRGNRLSDEVRDKNSVAGLSSTQYEQKQNVDSYLTNKIQSLLDGVLGVNNTQVRVDADLDFTQVSRVVEDYNPDRQVIVSEQTTSEKSKSLDSLNYPAVNSDAERSNTVTNYQTTKTIENVVGGVGSIKRISVAVTVNGVNKLVEREGQTVREYTPRSQEELDKIARLVRDAVGFDPARNDRITVEEIAFDTGFEEEIPPSFLGLPLTPEEFFQRVLLILGMLIAAFFLRRLIASPQIRKRIDDVFAPSSLEQYRLELAKAAAERQQALLKGLADESSLAMLPGADSLDDIAARARAKLELQEGGEVTEEMLLKQEVRRRVEEYFSQNPAEATAIVKIMLKQNTYVPSK